ncbi:helix-turn-helix transcriptional regulator [Streptomyces brevispora]|uniref:helix-turn-helix transcriptional regulator n=1 Tax=Streptomyces TaxID=1883 RepID=UPI000FA1E68F|nr:helix-turn-helix transcriptional regulator [Streptomyces sp. ADI92-24]RPK48352.1 Helix-turn-helix domain protein [Streptomyces sp. ADI92-24]
MPPRRFDGEDLRAARRRADLTQKQVAKSLGLSAHVSVARWEKGERFPPAEKMVGIAAILGVDVDKLFPREGPCDLVDLRCDAGYTQSAAAEEVEGLSRFVLGDAEGGRRRLDPDLIGPLSRLYGVDPDAFEAAEDRTFGVASPPAAPRKPPSLAEKLNGLTRKAFPGDPAPEMLANAINAKTGTRLTAAQVEALLAGASAADVFADGTPEVALTGIAAFFDVPHLALEDTAGVERRVLSDLQYLAAQHDVALVARGGDGGVSSAMLAVLNDLVSRHPGQS